MTQTYQLYIDGAWRAGSGGRTLPAINPYDQSVHAHIAVATEEDVDAAVRAARRAFEAVWSKSTPGERARLLNRVADLLDGDAERMALLETTDNGKVIRETHNQMGYAARIFRYYAAWADKMHGDVVPLDQKDTLDFAIRVPYGVIGAITAWNSPVAILCNTLPAALAAGNCVVLKPSEHASTTTLEIARLIERAGFPAGVVNVVTGEADTGRALVSNPGIDKISFTGSPGVGRAIAAAAGHNLKPLTLELGGKSPNIVFDDADFDRALIGALAGIFGATGQTCIAGSRLLVQRGIYERMVEGLAGRAARIRMGDPRLAETEMGTAANEPQFNRILSFIEDAKGQGARLVAGGGRAEGPGLENGFFIQPTIFADVRNEMKVASEEIFGPVLSIIPFDEEDEAVQIANDTAYGLASGIWSQDISRCLRMMRAIQSGVVWVNTYRVAAPQAPFGGMKDSGYGRVRGEAGILEFMQTKNVFIDFSGDRRDPFSMKF
ncbi:aldehyde dehydrogenase [Novosphingobium panipatense]|uniref:Aldehyde dehydrogenase (NAD+) n=1 Tax=Novosphingobium panipatense TaxID=428991 RepID=A0ABY1QXF3_9SPHN|nr:aldehyde dehydrogenase [Novosphingobium panipatense]SMP80548.1 aldehyde dehydrogenase (NAD+) [Novosphingobium panipatense]